MENLIKAYLHNLGPITRDLITQNKGLQTTLGDEACSILQRVNKRLDTGIPDELRHAELGLRTLLGAPLSEAELCAHLCAYVQMNYKETYYWVALSFMYDSSLQDEVYQIMRRERWFQNISQLMHGTLLVNSYCVACVFQRGIEGALPSGPQPTLETLIKLP